MAAVAAPKICREKREREKGRKGKKRKKRGKGKERGEKGRKGRGEHKGKMYCGCKTSPSSCQKIIKTRTNGDGGEKTQGKDPGEKMYM